MTTATVPPTRRAWLRIVALCACAVVHPLLDLLRRQVPFLLDHGLDGPDLVILVAVLALALPGVLAGGEVLVGVAGGPRTRRLTHGLIVAGLSSLFALVFLRTLGDPLPARLAVPLAAVLGIAAAWSVDRFAPVRLYLAFVAAAMPVAVVIFFAAPGVAGLVAARAEPGPGPPEIVPAAPAAGAPAPSVVIIVYDALPLVSLLDADLGIDATAYPNFAALAATATWYRNASTVWTHTSESIASILTGRIAESGRPPTRASYPDNFLTWMAATHEVRAVERVTRLAPAPAAAVLPARPRAQRLRELGVDLAVVYLHLVTPPELARALPSIADRWGGFWPPAARPRGAAEGEEAPVWEFALHDGRDRAFAAFLAAIEPAPPPRVYFAHFMLPHLPARYLPSGKVYGGRPVIGNPAEAWRTDPWFALGIYQRHLLQVGFIDRQVGALVERLRELDLFDPSLVVITSDHGVGHWPGENRRKPGKTHHPDDVLRVPLIVKAPFQTRGVVSDRNVQSIDIVPTLADLLGRPLPWPVDGRSAADPTQPEAPAKVLLAPSGGRLEVGPAFRPDLASLRRKLDIFAPGDGIYRFFRLGPHGPLLGRETRSLMAAAPAGCTVVLDQRPVLIDYAPASRYAPVQLTGELTCEGTLKSDAYLAFATRGRVQATAPLRRQDDGRRLFSVLMPEAVLVAGDNRPEVFLIGGTAEDPRLAPVPFGKLR